MAVLVYSEIETLFLEDLQSNVAADPPITAGVANQAGRFINDAYRTIWELSGGRLRKAPSGNAWTSAQLATGTAQGVLTDINEPRQVFATTQAPVAVVSVTTTINSAAISSAAGFTSVIVGGWHVSGTGIPSNTYVAAKTGDSNITLTSNATANGTVTLTFSPTESGNELDRRDLSYIHWLRSNSVGAYTVPKIYALVMVASPGTTDVNKAILEYWPGSTGYYFPLHYVPQMVPMDVTITTPDVNDLESADIAHLAALNFAALNGRAELAETCALKLSENTRLALDRKLASMVAGKQDDADAA